ncbi:MAG: hypothetical protein ING75_10195 [Rhodocyclaceae bacterium]|nr:hypothetical protein [Rhodocyclaceae bacterium]
MNEKGIAAEGCATKSDEGIAAKKQVTINRRIDQGSESPTNQTLMIDTPKSIPQAMIAEIDTVAVKTVSILVTDET